MIYRYTYLQSLLGYQECFDIIATKMDSDSVFSLGIKLNLSYDKVDEICMRNITKYQKIFAILVSWREKFGQQADINRVITSLKDMQKKAIADIIEEKLDTLK